MIFPPSLYSKRNFSFKNFDIFQVLLKKKINVPEIFFDKKFEKNIYFKFFFEKKIFSFLKIQSLKTFGETFQFFCQFLSSSVTLFSFRKSEVFKKKEKMLFSLVEREKQKNLKTDFQKLKCFLKNMHFFHLFSSIQDSKNEICDLFFAYLKKFPQKRRTWKFQIQRFFLSFSFLVKKKRKNFFFLKNQLICDCGSFQIDKYKNIKMNFQSLKSQSIEKSFFHHSKECFQFFQKNFFIKNFKKKVSWKWFFSLLNKSFFQNQFYFKNFEEKRFFKKIFCENFFLFLKNLFFWKKDSFFSFSNFFFSSSQILKKKFQAIDSILKKRKKILFFFYNSIKNLDVFEKYTQFSIHGYLLPRSFFFFSTTTLFGKTSKCSPLFSLYFFNFLFSKLLKNCSFCQNKKKQKEKCKKIFLKRKMYSSSIFSTQTLGIEQKNSVFVLSFLNFQDQKKLLVGKKCPSWQFIFLYLQECKNIIEKAKGQSAFFLLQFLSKKILTFSKKENYDLSWKFFLYLDQKIFQYLWNWAKKTHPKKSKNWIRQKYFYVVEKTKHAKWVFGQKIGNTFFYLPSFLELKQKNLFFYDFFHFAWIFQKNIF